MSALPLLHNSTPWLAEALPFVDDEGAEGQLVVVKIQYALPAEGPPQPVAQAEPLIHEDRFDDSLPPEQAPLLRPADVMAPQPGTNVLLVGHAHAGQPGGRRQFEPWLGVGSAVFPLRVHGPRHWRSRAWLSRLASLFLLRRFKPVNEGRVTRLPLAWQHAYGGSGWPHNPAGTGFHEDPRAATVKGLALPRIEDPRQPITRWQDRRSPQLPGAISPHWAPRAALGGTRDARWQATRAPAMPADGTPLFHNTAHPGLQFHPPLRGGEPVRAQGFGAGAGTGAGEVLDFALPAHALQIHRYHYGGFTSQALALNTVLIDADRRCLTLLYRAFVPERHEGQVLRRLVLSEAPVT